MTFSASISGYDPSYPETYSTEKQAVIKGRLTDFVKSMRAEGFAISGAYASGGGFSISLSGADIGGPLPATAGTTEPAASNGAASSDSEE